MKEHKEKDLSSLIELHLELKAKEQDGAVMDELPVPDYPEEEGTLPPRKTLFPSKRTKWTQVFYNTLLVIFLLLVASLLIWGFRLNG